MFPKASLTGRVVRTNNTMRMAKSWGAWRRPGAGATWAIILRIAPTTGYVAPYLWNLFFQPHSLRRTKATLIYRRTGNLRAVQLLLGHTKIESTVRYLGIEVDDALAIAEQVDV